MINYYLTNLFLTPIYLDYNDYDEWWAIYEDYDVAYFNLYDNVTAGESYWNTLLEPNYVLSDFDYGENYTSINTFNPY